MFSMARRLTGWACLTLIAAFSPPLLAADAPSAAAFAKPHQLVDIGGRKMNLYCSGHGATTVVFDAPSGDAGWNWFKVQPAVAAHTRACVFDRAGLGFSDPAKRPNTAEHVAEDLHHTLAGAGIKPPYLLVGNSLGGANVQVFAYRYPAEVKGLVLVEPRHEDEAQRMDKVSQGNLGKMFAMVAGQYKFCLDAARAGFKAGSEAQANCVGNPDDVYGPALGKAVLAATSTPAYWQTVIDEWDAIKVSDEQLRKRRRSFGDMPVMVLTRGVSPYAEPGKPQSALNKATEDENFAIQKEVAALSTRGQQQVVPGAGHVVQAEKPQAVIDAVLEVLKMTQ
jgi:pimeloyl-ACP methyl ester carboxylesterase